MWGYCPIFFLSDFLVFSPHLHPPPFSCLPSLFVYHSTRTAFLSFSLFLSVFFSHPLAHPNPTVILSSRLKTSPDELLPSSSSLSHVTLSFPRPLCVFAYLYIACTSSHTNTTSPHHMAGQCLFIPPHLHVPFFSAFLYLSPFFRFVSTVTVSIKF